MTNDSNPYRPPQGVLGPPLSGHSFRAAQWRMLLATMFCYLFYYTGRQTFGFAIPGIQEEYGWSKEQLGWCSTALLWSYALGQAINGNLADKFGGRRLMSLGAVLSCGLNWLTSLSTSLFQLGATWAANGYVQSFGWAPGGRVITNWWSRLERGKVFGLYLFAAGMSSVLSFVLAIVVVDFGWRWIFRIPVLLLLAAGILYYLIARDHPSELGFESPEEEDPENLEATSADSTTESPGEKESSRERYAAVLGNWRFLIAGLSIGFQNAARYGLLIWVPVHFLGKEWKETGGGYAKWIAIALPLGMALGALTSGYISDRFLNRRRWPVIIGALLPAAVVSGAMYWIPQDQILLAIVLLFLAGFLVYAPQSAYWSLCPDMLGYRRAATATGIMNAFAYVFAGLGEPLIGFIIDQHENATDMVFIIVAICCLTGGLLAPLIRR